MNISFFLKPKVEVSYLTESCPVQKAIDDMLRSGFTAIPVVDAKGKYAGTITEGDFLRLVLHYPKETLEQLTVGQVELRIHHRSVSIDARMEDMVDLVTAQNFVPVVDGRGIFCGIGQCTDCMMVVNGIPNVRTCITPVEDGMTVETQEGLGEWREQT